MNLFPISSALSRASEYFIRRFHVIVGDIVDTGNPCETCTCENSGDIICAMTDCPRCPGKVVPVEGRCCGDCFVGDIQIIAGRGCIKDEVGYRFGEW